MSLFQFIKMIFIKITICFQNLNKLTRYDTDKKKLFAKKLRKNPNHSIIAPLTVVHLQPYLLVKIEAIGSLINVTASNRDWTMLG